jgi:hypothetical protein
MVIYSTKDINQWLGREPGYLGCFALNNLPTTSVPPIPQDFKLVVNLDTDNLPGTHWIAIIRIETQIEIFDSYGLIPVSQIQLWCNKHCIKWSYNTIAIQQLNTTLCGMYCCLFLTSRPKFRNLNETAKCLSKII